MSPADLFRSRDGSMSLTKLAALTFHFWIAIAVVSVTVVRIVRYVMTPIPGLAFDSSLFDLPMWTLWASIAVGHAVVDKGVAQIAAFKDKKLDAETGSGGLR